MSFSALTISASGLDLASARIEASSSNVANVLTSGPVPGSAAAEAGSAKLPPAVVYQPVRVIQSSTGGDDAPGGVGYRFDRKQDYTLAYDPQNPDANEDGMIAMPNVDLAQEAVEQSLAVFQFQASMRTMQAANEMLKTVIDQMA